MKRAIRGLFRLVHFPAAFGLTSMAIVAAFGFWHPLLDALNHLQPLWFLGTLVILLIAPFIYERSAARALMIAVGATGFFASAVVVVPEAAARFVAREPVSGQTFTLLDYNVFGLNHTMGDVARMIARVNPDIVTLQEYYPDKRMRLHRLIVGDYPYHVICSGLRRANLAIYSRLPFSEDTSNACNWGDPHRRSALLVVPVDFGDGRIVRIATTQNDWPIQISPWRNGPDALVARQQEEFAHLSSQINTLTDPVILAGDFNSTSWSYQMKAFVRESGMVRQTRSLFTWPALFYLGSWTATPAFLPLDQVFTRGDVNVTGVHTDAPSGSDHLPVVVTFAVGQ